MGRDGHIPDRSRTARKRKHDARPAGTCRSGAGKVQGKFDRRDNAAKDLDDLIPDLETDVQAKTRSQTARMADFLPMDRKLAVFRGDSKRINRYQTREKALFSALLQKTEKVYKERFPVRLMAVFNMTKNQVLNDMRKKKKSIKKE